MKIQSYQELIAYQKAYQLVLLVYRITQSFPKEEMYCLTNQIRRCAVSIPSNIAEGYMRGSQEYMQFLKVGLGSSAELESQLSLSKDLGYCSISSHEEAHALNNEVMKLLKSYIKNMRSEKVVTNR
jgi:four helix bundle protein